MLNHEPYLNFVAQEASKMGKQFVLDTGEGRDFIDDKTGWYIEDLTGWLIEPNKINIFIAARENGTEDETYADAYVFAIWSKDENGQLKITFKKY